MTVLIKYSRQTKKSNKLFFEKKDTELTNLDWAKWGGWFDTDGGFYSKNKIKMVGLKLKDREPVELFAKTFETSLLYQEHRTKTPNGNTYLAKEYTTNLTSKKAIWFTQNVKKYIFNKTMDVKTLLNSCNISYIPYEHEFTKDELLSYMSSALQGDGTFYDRNKTKEFIKFYSANINYLKFIQNQLNKYNIQFGGPYKGLIYKTEKGTRQQFQLSLLAKNNLNAINFFENIIPGIEMIRKKVNAENSLKWLKERQ